ncbi:zinc finger protein ZFAT-like [Cydia pomonella]|uniref:zinc finger protein ZFAT-like n=1 Tax=Cydia pomonella TaxID=82600 RepID=UPI002ADE948A|nr:zinc finger protein ZFAT-like [Cydia pomonella]
MTENNRKRCRKSKLVPRECVDYVEDDSVLQEPVQKKLLLEKIKKEPEDYIPPDPDPSTHKFSVEVEIEGMDTAAPDEDAPDYMKYLFSLSKEPEDTAENSENLDFADNSLLLEQKLTIPMIEEEKNCVVDVKKLQKMLVILHRKYPKELEVVMHCRNQWGRAFHEKCPTEFKKAPKEILLHDVLSRWKQWTIVTRARESPYCYKCYICDNGWWTYTEFATHITQHTTYKLQIQTRNLECDIVAYEGDSAGVKDVEIHGKCTKCAKTYNHHLTNKRATDAYYYCNYCDERFQTCRTLTKHEGGCPRNPIRVLAISKAGKEYSFSDFSCEVCKTLFLSNPDLEEHMIICHKVRSDEPIVTVFKTCKDCEQNYYNFFFHVCLKKNFVTECKHCLRKFQNKQMLEHHYKMWDKIMQCRICDKYLVKSCMAAEHYALHSEEFLLVHRCLVCKKIKVFTTEDAMRNHVNKYHKRFDARRPKTDKIIMPTTMLQQCMVDQVKKNPPKPVLKSTTSKATSKGSFKLTRGETVPQIRVYVPVHKNKPSNVSDGSPPINTTIAHDDTTTMRPDAAPELIAPVQIKQEKDVTVNIPALVPIHITVPVPEKVPEISEMTIKVEKMDIDEEKITNSAPGAQHPVSEVKEGTTEKEVSIENEDRKDMNNIMAELTEFLDIKPDVIKEEKLSDDEAAQATKELTNLLQMSNTESDISKVFKASSTFAEEVTDNSEHSTVFQISKTVLESVKQEKYVVHEDDPIAVSPNASSQSVSETSDLSSLNLEPEVILKAGYRKRKIYKCNKCDYSGFHREYREHINNRCSTPAAQELVSDDYYRCTKCDKGFSSLKKYALHFDKHGYLYMSCPQCGQDFESVTKLMPHLNSHLKGQFFKVQIIKSCEDTNNCKMYQCKSCTEVVGQEKWFEHWEKHLELLKPAEKVPQENIQVGEHGERSLNASSLEEVLVILTKQFNNEYRHAKSCVVCSRVFERKNDTKRHLIEHLLEDAYANMLVNQTLKCQICGEQHKKPDNYKKHMRDHANLPIYKCGLCNKTFSDSSNFTKHKKIHNLKAYICDICSKKFQAKVSLEKHIQMHMKTAPITCEQCPRVFHDRSFYNRHYRQHHDKLLTRFRCMLCREKFPSLREKWDHLWEVHKQRKENADCPICGVSYRKFIDVKKHAFRVHGKSITLSSLWSLLSKIRGTKELGVSGEVGEGSRGRVKEEVSSDDDCLLIEEELETLVVYD